MIPKKSIISIFFVFLTVAMLTYRTTYGGGGRIEGKVTDVKGAVILGATVVATGEVTRKSFTVETGRDGRFKLEGLPIDTYTVVVSAEGFAEVTKVAVNVGEGAVVPLEIRLEIAPVEAKVTVETLGARANSDPIYQLLRKQAKGDQDFAGAFASVNELALKREGAIFLLHSGEIYFPDPVEGRVTGAVFIGEGEVSLVPPTETEKNSIKIFTNEPSLNEKFNNLVLRFTDQTFEQVKGSQAAKMGTAGPQAARARDLYRDNQQLMRKRIRDNRELRTLADIYAPQRPGFFNAFIDGRRFNKLVYILDPMAIPEVAPEEVALLSYGESDGGFWTAFHRFEEYAKGTANSDEDHRIFDITHHQIEATIKGTQINATDKITFQALVAGTRVLPFNLYRSLRVTRVQDESQKDLTFIQEGKDEDPDLGVILPEPLKAGKSYSITVEYAGGEALRDSGGGNFILIPRLTWYPNNAGTAFGDRAIFDMTFRYPKNMTFVGTGARVGEDTREGDAAITKWSSGAIELQVAGFNYGKFKKKEVADKESGYNIEFYANEEVPDELKEIQNDIDRLERQGYNTDTTLGSISTTKIGELALADAQNATRIYDAYFGKLPYSRLAMTQQPAGFFGQAWPTLVFMPYLAFVDSTQRTQLLGIRGGTNNFWRYVAPHEIAHQWWGHIIGWDSYHDQWMSEGFAEFSSSLYVQYIRKDLNKFVAFWEDQRKLVVDAQARTKNRRPYSIGPITQGIRLSNGKTDEGTGAAYQFLVYPKGAYVLHMLRMMMYNAREGDAKFQAMMKDFVQTYFNKNVSTEDFKLIVERHMTKEMNAARNGRMDWFFNQWVYGTEVPAYRFEYQIAPDGTLSGRITQSGVSENFVMVVPLYLDYGKGWAKLGSATLVGNTTLDITNMKLPGAPKRAAICALNDVLATSIQNGK